MINLSTSVHSLQPTAVGMGFPEMVSHGVGSPQASIRSTGEGYTSHGGVGGEQSEMMPGGQHVKQVQMAKPSLVRMAMGQQDTPPHVIPSYNPPTGAGVGPFAAVSRSPLMSLGPTLRTSSEQGVSPQQLTPPPSQQAHTPPPPSDPQMLQTQPPHSSPPSTSQLQPQGVPQPGSSIQEELVSE